ncbi:hypothetical protein ABPG74_017931 [Tetrahymena malaccensis]
MLRFNQIYIFILAVFAVQCIQYDKAESLNYLFYQKASYCPRNNITNWECGNICKFHPSMKDILVYYNDTHAAQGYLGFDRGQIVITFRGSTRTLTNWIYNFDVKKSPFEKCQNCSIHSGFLKTYNDIKDQLLKNLDNLISKYPAAPIIISGHSLGGAIATIAAIDIQHFLNERSYQNVIKEVHTFGSPRVGNQAFAEYYNQLIPQTARVVNNQDIVPHLPPNKIGYYHVGTEIWLDKEFNQQKDCQPFIEDNSCSKSVKSIVSYSFFDHVNYLGNDTGCKAPFSEVICYLESGIEEGCVDQDLEEIISKARNNKMKLLFLTQEYLQN